MDDAASILSSIKRYQALRLHEDVDFASCVLALQQWRLEAMLTALGPECEGGPKGDLLEFYLSEVLLGVHLHELNKKTNIVKVIEKLFTGTDMLTVGLEFNALTFEISEKLVEQLHGVAETGGLDVKLYVEACHRAAVLDDMEYQLALFEKFSVYLDEAIRDPIVIAGLKVSKIPARMFGFKRLHKLLSHGFKLAKKAGDPRLALADVITLERQAIANIRRGANVIYSPVETGSN